MTIKRKRICEGQTYIDILTCGILSFTLLRKKLCAILVEFLKKTTIIYLFIIIIEVT